ncbi:MAG: right-handed parallel beta-helix repeat-containing protein [Pirellulales bacterium]|nr:right-handed parallel beta-helix repeat-containing protein [Pirellulales bacterium]
MEWLETRNLLAVFHVSLSGADTNDGSAGAPFRSLQAAVAAASTASDSADRILIASGTYNDPAHDGAVEVAADDELDTLQIEGGYASDFLSRDIVDAPTIYAPQSGATGITLGDAGITLDGIQLLATDLTTGIDLRADAITLRDVKVTGGNVGIAADLIAAPSLVRINISQTTDAAIALENLSGTLLLDNLTIADNSGAGLRAKSLGGNSTIQAGVYNNNAGDALSFTSTQRVTATNITATGNGRGLVVDTAAGVTITGGNYTDNVSAGVFLTHVSLPGALVSGLQASATAGIALHVVDAIGLQLTDPQLSSAAPHPGAVLESVNSFVYIASSGAEDDVLHFRNGLLTHKRNDIGRSTVAIPLSTAVALSGGNGNDSLSIGTGSGYQDIVDVLAGQVVIRRGPNPLEAASQNIGYDSIETLTVSTEGGADTIAVTLAPTGALPAVLNLNADDENDGIEINHALMNRAITINLDGGAGTNGLTVFTRSPERDRVIVRPDSVAVRPGPTNPPRPEQTTNFAKIYSLGIYSGDGDDTIEVRMAGTADAIPLHIDAGGGSNDDVRFLTESGYEDLIRIEENRISVQFGPTPQSARARTIPFVGTEIVQVFAAGGADTITIAEPAHGTLPRGIAIFGQDENDTIRLLVGNRTSQVAMVIDGGLGDLNQFELYTNSGYEDVVTMDGLNLVTQIGPDPLSAQTKTASLNNIWRANIRTAGGADSITISPASTGTFIAELNIYSEDEADQIAINLGASALASAINIDGGNGEGDTLIVNDIPNINGHLEVDYVAAPGVFGVQRVELINLLGGTGADTLINKTAFTAVLNGGPGNDTLLGGAGIDFLLGGAGNDVMNGGGGIDMLLGSAGDDSLYGGGGRDLLIGGAGGDFLDGGDDDDILIAGTTVFDDQQTALDAIFGEWTTFRPYLTRVANLTGQGTGPRRNGDIFLIGGLTVFDDASALDIDTLVGGGGNDLFFLNIEEDLLQDLQGVEVAMHVTQSS